MRPRIRKDDKEKKNESEIESMLRQEYSPKEINGGGRRTKCLCQNKRTILQPERDSIQLRESKPLLLSI